MLESAAASSGYTRLALRQHGGSLPICTWFCVSGDVVGDLQVEKSTFVANTWSELYEYAAEECAFTQTVVPFLRLHCNLPSSRPISPMN